MTEPAMYRLPLRERRLGPILRRRAAEDGDRVYMAMGGRSLTFAETDAQVRGLARGMAARGTGKGDFVAVFMPNGPDFVLAWYAAVILGAAFVPINIAYKGFMLDGPLRDTGARGMVIHRDLLPSLASADPALRAGLDWVAVAGGLPPHLPEGPKEYLALEDLAQNGPDPEAEADFRDIHCVMYTSGTTGPSKGVLLSNAHFFSSAMTFLRALALTRDDTIFTNLPLFHGLASRLGALPAMMMGARLVIGERFSATSFWDDVIAAEATIGHTLFTIPHILKARPPGPNDRAHRLRAMYNAHHDAEFEDRFGVRLVEAYGLTETGLMVYTPWPERKFGTAGRIHEDFEAQTVDEADLPVDPGAVGEIVVRPKLPYIMMQGYLNRPEETLRAWRNLWFHTGDLARMDADGYITFVDRVKDRIRRRGENISSWDVEHYVSAHPDIEECVALPHPAPGGEDDIRVVYVTKDGREPDPVALMDWFQGRAPHFMLPRYLERVEAIPRSPTAKVEKYKLVEAGLSPSAWDREAAGYQVRRDRVGGRDA
jgi:carnitine-CoA ligase